MLTKISSSGSKSCYYGGFRHKNDTHRNPTTIIENPKKIDRPPRLLLTCTAKYGINYRDISISRNIKPKASSSGSPEPSSSSWKKWLMGILFTLILPAAGHKGGLLLGLKGKIDQAIETVEHVTEVVEEMAEKADQIMEEVEAKLPGDSKLKEALDSFEDLAKMAVKEAKKAEDLVHKVKEVEAEIDNALLNCGKDQEQK
ncbi:hypothetical protein ABFS83_12G014400 [Erythranthe nasuta]